MDQEKRKPTLEEMFESYRQYSMRIDEACKKAGGVQVDFTKLPTPYRHIVRKSRVRTLLVSAIVLLFSFLFSAPYASAMNYQTDITRQVAIIEEMHNNLRV